MSDIKLDSIDKTEEIDIGDIFKFFIDHWKQILSLSVLGASLGGGYSLITNPIYEAIGTIQIGKVANVEFESPVLLLAKLTLPNYYSDETLLRCRVSNGKNPREEIIKKIKPVLSKSSQLIALSVRQGSPEIAKQCLNTVLKDIRGNQSEMMSELIKAQRDQLESLRVRLSTADSISKKLDNQFERQGKLNTNQEKMTSPPDSLVYSHNKRSELELFVFSIGKKSEIEDLRAKINDLTAQLSPPRTTESNFVTPVYASDLPVNPSPLLVALLSGLGACVLSVIYLLAKNMLRRSRAQSEAAYS